MNATDFAPTTIEPHRGIDVNCTAWLLRMDAAIENGRRAQAGLQSYLDRPRRATDPEGADFSPVRAATPTAGTARRAGDKRPKIRLADFAPTTMQPAAGVADPHVAGRRAQIAHLARCRIDGVVPRPRDLDTEYWRAYRAIAGLAR